MCAFWEDAKFGLKCDVLEGIICAVAITLPILSCSSSSLEAHH